jgi:glucose-1-phosphate adenylyltransferase
MRSRKVFMHPFDGYWEDIGTIKSFYQCNLDLAAADPPFELVSAEAPIYTRARMLPPSRIEGAQIRQSLISDGCVIGEGAAIENSVIGIRCRIGRGAKIRNSVVMGADEYDSPATMARSQQTVPQGIGDGSEIDGVIVDKNCRIGAGVRVVNDQGLDSSPETPEYMICDGIVVVQKGAVLPDGWKL